MTASALSTWGSVPAWITSIVVVAAAWSFRRGGGGTAIASLEAANRVLEKRVQDLEHQAHEKDRMISELKGRTDVSIALTPLLEISQRHERQAQERHEKTLIVLDLIAARLGSDGDN